MLISEACRGAQQTLLAAKSQEVSLDTSCSAELFALLGSPSLRGTLVLLPTPPGASLAQSQLRMLCLLLPWKPPSLPGCHGSPAPSRSHILSIERIQCFGSSGASTTGNVIWGLGMEGQARAGRRADSVLASPHHPDTVGGQAQGPPGTLRGWWGRGP